MYDPLHFNKKRTTQANKSHFREDNTVTDTHLQ